MSTEKKQQLRIDFKKVALSGGNVLDNAFDFMLSKLSSQSKELAELRAAIHEAIQVIEPYNTGEDFAMVTSLRRLKEIDTPTTH